MKNALVFQLVVLIWCGGCSSPSEVTADDAFAQGTLLTYLGSGGYIDSPFLSHDGKRLYFLYSTWNTSDFLAGRNAECPKGPDLPGHQVITGAEFATDLYFVEWEGKHWSEPHNLGPTINSGGLECCMWLNDDETEIIFGSTVDSPSLTRNGNYISTRPDKDAPWGPAQALPGRYGPGGRGTVPGPTPGSTIYYEVTDLHRTPSKDVYGWETDKTGLERLVYGRWNGTSNDEPVLVPGTESKDTQVWVSADELVMLYNHRTEGIDTALRTMTRTSRTAPWSSPAVLPTTGFADPNGLLIWGEPTLTADGTSMLFVRFNSSDPNCWRAEIMRARGTPTTGYSDPEVLN